MDLFDTYEDESKQDSLKDAPLAIRMRPRTIEEFVGQEHFFGPDKMLRRMLEADRLSSIILYGPPGTGKTALAHIIANTTKSRFYEINASLAGVEEVKKVLKAALRLKATKNQRTVLFIDEIHRFNKLQQDVLLNDVEKGTIILVGATTENPFFSINSPLISRSQIFQLKSLTDENIATILKRALSDEERGMGAYNVQMKRKAFEHLIKYSDGDARRALNALEVGILSSIGNDTSKKVVFDLTVAEESIQRKAIYYDKKGDIHYDAASAFIKSMRGSDPDAALYWMARMIEAGEDIRFIARRIVILAAEDVGNADPQALVVANAALQISEFIGLPEAKIPLAQAVTYVSCAPKSNASYLAIAEAIKDVEKEKTQEVPDHLKDASYRGAKKLGHGVGYKYAHSYEGHWVDQEYLRKAKIYYNPTDEGYEKIIKERLEKWRSRKKETK